jgi:hypothetical protein
VFRGEQGTVFVMDVNHSIATEATGRKVVWSATRTPFSVR